MESEVNVPVIINEIKSEKRWSADGSKRENEFADHIERKFETWSEVMTQLCNAEKYNDFELIVQEILNLRNALDNVFPKEMEDFVIDKFLIGDRTVKVWQYFSPQRFYPDKPVLKHMKFTVYRGDEVIMHYFLESSKPRLILFVLGWFNADYTHHSQIDVYGHSKPTYQHIKRTVIADMTIGIQPIISSRRNVLMFHFDRRAFLNLSVEKMNNV